MAKLQIKLDTASKSTNSFGMQLKGIGYLNKDYVKSILLEIKKELYN